MVLKNKYSAGDILITPNYGEVEIIEYINNKDVTIKFINTGYIASSQQLKAIFDGRVRDKLVPYLYGVGVIGEGVCSSEGIALREYTMWSDMLRRCYCEKFKQKYLTYTNCETSNNFKNFPFFKSWCNEQIGFNNDGWQLDKDILIKGNKVYSEDLCVFVPQEINTFFTKRDLKRGEYLVGVSYNKRDRKFVVNLSFEGSKIIHKGFDTELEAFLAYKTEKALCAKKLANKWSNEIDPRVYEAMMNYEVSADD